MSVTLKAPTICREDNKSTHLFLFTACNIESQCGKWKSVFSVFILAFHFIQPRVLVVYQKNGYIANAQKYRVSLNLRSTSDRLNKNRFNPNVDNGNMTKLPIRLLNASLCFRIIIIAINFIIMMKQSQCGTFPTSKINYIRHLLFYNYLTLCLYKNTIIFNYLNNKNNLRFKN